MRKLDNIDVPALLPVLACLVLPSQADHLQIRVLRLACFAVGGCWSAGQPWPAAWQHLPAQPPPSAKQLLHPQTWSESRIPQTRRVSAAAGFCN